MKLLYTFLISFLFYFGVNGSVAIEFTKNGTDGQGDCVSINPKVGIMKLGEQKTLEGVCYQATCSSGGEINYMGCGVISLSTEKGRCLLEEEDLSKPYPGCCRPRKCKGIIPNTTDDDADAKA